MRFLRFIGNPLSKLIRILGLILFLFALLAELPAEAQTQRVPLPKFEAGQEPIRIQADHIAYDRNEDMYTAEGKVEIFQGDRKLTADRVTLNGKTHEAEATGNVILVQGDDVLRSQKMKVNLDTNLGIIVRGMLFLKKQHFYLRGEEIERIGEETYRIRKGSFTTCDGDWPAWRFTSREIIVTLEEYASAYGTTFEIKNVPVLYSPYLVFPVKTQRQSGFLIPRLTYSNLSGVEFDNAYFWAIAKNMDATFYLDLASQKGIGEGVEFRYARKPDSNGQFYAYHLREMEGYREKRTDQLDRKPDRWQVDFQHEEYFDSSFFAKTRLRAVSDREFFRDYGQAYEDRSSEQVFSFVSLTKNWESSSLFGEARHTVDLRQEDKTTLQDYPIVNFLGVRKQLLKSPLYYSFHSSYGYFSRETGVSGQQADVHPTLSLPMKWSFLEVTPELGGRATLYSVRDGQEDTHSRESWDFNTTVATEMYRVFDTGFAGLPRLKHVIRPEITYTYLPDTNQQLIPFPYFPYFDPTVPKANTLTYGVTQYLIGKVSEGQGKSRYQEFAYLKLSQSYDLFEANRNVTPGSSPRRPFGPITADLRLYWLQYLSAESITSYDPNQGRFVTSYSSIGINDPRGDSLNVEYTWARGLQNQINAWLRVRLHSSLDVLFGKRYSQFDNQSLETFYGIQYRQQCWMIDLIYSERPEVAGQPAEKKVQVLVNLIGVTSLGRR